MQKIVAFITEAGTHIGYGHLYRTLALSQGFLEKDFIIDFYCDDENGKIILNKNQSVTEIFNLSELEHNIENYPYVVFDLYKDSWIDFIQIVENTSKPITISLVDYAFRMYSINTEYIFQIGYQNYNERIICENEGKVKIISGNDFFIFREEFSNTPEFIVKKDINKLLVSMGGSDPYCLTELVIASLSKIKNHLEVSIVLGAGFNDLRYRKLLAECNNLIHNFSFLRNINNIAEVMVSNDLAVINGGNTRFELSSLGIPFISISVTDTQNIISKAVESGGIGKNLGVYTDLSDFDISMSIQDMLQDYDSRLMQSTISRKRITKDGVNNIISNVIS